MCVCECQLTIVTSPTFKSSSLMVSCYAPPALGITLPLPSLLGKCKKINQHNHNYQVPYQDHIVLVHFDHGVDVLQILTALSFGRLSFLSIEWCHKYFNISQNVWFIYNSLSTGQTRQSKDHPTLERWLQTSQIFLLQQTVFLLVRITLRLLKVAFPLLPSGDVLWTS